MTVRLILSAAVLAAAAALSPSGAARAQAPDAPQPETLAPPSPQTARAWIEQMKDLPRGPFSRLRWFCADGQVLDPTPFGCEPHGGGVQHGEWSEQTRLLRAAGYPVANVLADLKPTDAAGPDAPPDRLSELLLEKFLVAFDNGWILRKARFYRGAFQEYNERDSANAILRYMLGHPQWRTQHLMLRETARLLPHGADSTLLTQMRGLATTIAEQDPGFEALRSKIHLAPEPADAQRVREYAAGGRAKAGLQTEYARLVEAIDASYQRKSLPTALRALAVQSQSPGMSQKLRELASHLEQYGDTASQFTLGAEVLVEIRNHILELGPPSVRLDALDLSLHAEGNVFGDSRTLLEQTAATSRAHLLEWLGTAARALYGMGLLSYRELGEVSLALQSLTAIEVDLETYRDQLQVLQRVPGWASRRLEYFFGNAIDTFRPIEPLADMFIPDRLRGSVMLFYSSVLEQLSRDADRLGNTPHTLFGEPVGEALRRLNPGIARGVLRTPDDLRDPTVDSAQSILLVPETLADLPPVAGILTADEGNSLSHVQLLARNLGIPNVVVAHSLMPELARHRGETIAIAASPGGVVEIAEDGPQWRRVIGLPNENPQASIVVELDKLDLDYTALISTRALRAAYAGRIVGPKAAGVGELSHAFSGMVSPGLAIPFGVYRRLLDRPVAPGQPSMFEWMKARYAEFAVLRTRAPDEYAKRLPRFLAQVRDWIVQTDLDPGFVQELRASMEQTFGKDGSYGVFVRSDTNIEDLPGFTGAGLNKTVPNVVGFEHVLDAIKQVWASPFSERAFGWRQSLMDHPEHVYASVLLHRSVPSEKSGVMVTADIDSGARDVITIVTSPGVGGGVEGQAAETLRVSMTSGAVRLLSSTSARTRRVLPEDGGVATERASAPDYLLSSAEINQLLLLAHALPERYPQLLDADGNPAPADVEFGFVDGKLMLFQIRPFLQNRIAARSEYLAAMDTGLRESMGRTASMMLPPMDTSR